MKNLAIKAENISKQYRLGKVGTGTLSHDLNRLWCKVRGLEDPYLKIGEANDRSSKGESEYVWSLRDINFEIEQGDAVGIIGRNGAGKSTLLKLLSKVTKPTTGSFKVNGKIASLLEVGTGFNPEMTGRENIYLNGAILGMRRAEITRKLDEIIAFSGVERYIDTPVKRYSSGMYVRLAFAVAAHLESDVLIIDEVLAVGDAEFQKKCLGKMNDVSKEDGRTVLFVSHNLLAVQNLCNKGLLLEKGRITCNDHIDILLEKYTSSFQKNKGIKPNIEKEVYLNDFRCYEKASEKKIVSGNDAILEFNINSKINISGVIIGIGINDHLGNRIITPVSSKNDKLINLEIGQNIVKCEMPSILLKPGTYFAEISIGTKDIILDYYDKGIVIEIELAKKNLIKQLPSISQGYIIVNQNWI
ncbi:MAG: ABC transporter ATP-binding protein [Flavobacterium sp.]|nr:ABC transporter ATP-binding protein [Flavobacterium sp.]